ncbi:MAG: efflux system, outer rane lipoprotein NodT family [Lacunisphaera sp.]|nr:efflux system, outer rane lipoprotein NodT family [Lacunisphaera sp.]
MNPPPTSLPRRPPRPHFLPDELSGSTARRLAWPGLGLAGLTLLAGCAAVGPDYRRPEAAALPATYAGVSDGWKVAQPQGQLPKGNWWEIFADPELNALEEQAAAANQQLKAAVQRFAEARASVDVTRAGLFPNASLSASAVRQRTSANAPLASTGQAIGQSSIYNVFSTPLDLSYEVDLWGRVRRSVESAQARMQASADDLEGIKLLIQAEVATDYFNQRALDAERAALISSVEVFTKSYDLTRNRRAGGVANDLEVAQAETVLKATQAQLPAVALQRARFEHALALLVGQPASSFRLPERALVAQPPVIPAGLPSELLERRPDISAAERLMAAANANIGVAKAAFFPSLNLGAVAGLESLSTGNLLTGAGKFWAVGPLLSLPLFEGGKLRAGLRFSQATYAEMVANYRQTVLAAFADVEDNLAAQGLLAVQYAAESGALEAARKQLEVANNRYRDGLITYLEVATAESTMLNLEFSTVQLRGQQLVAAVALVRSLGGGWQESKQP